jgi:transcriptional regulator with XRE-family HTH domain
VTGGAFVAKIVSKAFQLRLEYQKRQGRNVPISEVARLTGLDRKAITRLEENSTERYDGDVLAKLCEFYGVGVCDLLEFNPEDMRMPGLVAAVQSAY